jgi:hypothetical protein
MLLAALLPSPPPHHYLFYTPPSITYFLKESTKKDRYRSGFGGIQNDIGCFGGF